MKKFVFIVILVLMSTDISFSEEKKKSSDEITNYFKKQKEEHSKKNAPIDFEEVIKLGEPIIIEDLPEGMVKKFGKSCTEFLCRTKKATTIMARSFKRSEDYNNRKPGNMIQAMGYFELFYMGQLRKNKMNLERYKKNHKNKDKLNLAKKVVFKADEIKIRALIKTNEGRKSMREALGMDLELDPVTAINRFWYLGELLEFSNKINMSIVIENHGGYTSDVKWLIDLIKSINHPKLGTLPDFGTRNFCIKTAPKTESGIFGSECVDQYDKYKGVKEMLPYAKGISAKSHTFNNDGEEMSTNYKKMINLIKASGFNEYIAIEYEGAIMALYGKGNSKFLSSHEGVLATKKLIEKYI